MLTITVDELEHISDPVAQLVWRLWIRQGRARLLEPLDIGWRITSQKRSRGKKM